MAHFLAEKIRLADSASGKARAEAESQCFDVILRLWKHRASFPQGSRPLETFAPIMQTLSRLFADSTVLYFAEVRDSTTRPPGSWMELARNVDSAAGSLIEWCVMMATKEALKKEGKWLDSEIGRDLDDSPDLQVAQLLATRTEILVGSDDQLRELRIRRLSQIKANFESLAAACSRMQPQIERALFAAKSSLGEGELKTRRRGKKSKKVRIRRKTI